MFGHAALPREQDVLEFLEVEGDKYPLFIAHEVYLEVMEREGHGQFAGVRARVAVAISMLVLDISPTVTISASVPKVA